MSATLTGLSHVLPAGSGVNERGHLEIGGCDVVELAREFGTPAYLVAEDDLRARARSFRDELSARHPDSDVLFASKAFPCTAVYRALAEEGLGCDVASGGELALALHAGFPPERIYFHGNAKSRRELAEALRAGVGQVVVDSFDDLQRLTDVALEASHQQAVLLRITPDVAGDTHQAISTGQANSKFGFALAEAEEAIARLARTPELQLQGLHFHIGSQLFELTPFREAIRAVATLGDFPVYNLGGGLAAAYTSAQRPPVVGEYLDALVGTAQAELGTGKRLLIEPGRALVANSTVTAYTVESVKRNLSTWVAVDGGMSDNLRPMLYGSEYEALLADRPLLREGEICQVAGKHCESGDVVVRNVALPDPVPGDVLVTPVTGAYGYALSNNYNGIPRPPVIFCRDGQAQVVVRREIYADLMARDLEVADPGVRG